MKYLFIFILLLFNTSQYMYGQSIERNVLASAGHSFITNSYQGSFTVGEAIIGTVTNDNHHLSQGFQQPSDMSVGTEEIRTIEVKLAPNPTNGIVEVSSDQVIDEIIIFSSLAKVIGQVSPRNRSYNLDLSQLTNGVYFISTKSSQGFVLNKIVKY